MLKAFLGIVLVTLLFAWSTTKVQNKPWGVPDALRTEYDAKLDRLAVARTVAAGSSHIAVASLHAPTSTVHLQNVVSGDIVKESFEVQNKGELALKLHADDEQEFDFDWSLSGFSVAPKSSTIVTLSWIADDSQREQSRHLLLETNDPIRPKVRFSVYATVSRPLVVPEVVAVGKVGHGDVFESSFCIASETAESLGVVGISSVLQGFDWTVESVDPVTRPADIDSAAQVVQVSIRGLQEAYGPFSEQVVLDLLIDGEPVQRSFMVSGNVKAPIAFIHPEMHQSDGMSIGTISSEKDFFVNVAVRHRGEEKRTLAVLDYSPEFLQPSLNQAGDDDSSSRLVIKIPRGTPTHAFNRPDQHGYIEIGDPDDPGFSGWFPIYGAVVQDF